MDKSKSLTRYVIISPAKDESARIEKTIQSILAQTVRPAKWVIVDDGSSDNTAEIVERYCGVADWISLIRVSRDASRKLGSAEIRAFNKGSQSIRIGDFDYLVKLDCDLDLPPDYFEQLIERFNADERLGIASGLYYEKDETGWVPAFLPPYHAAGASKMIRAQCYRDIGGFPLDPGWDSADEIKAQVRGWKTAHFPEIQFRHLRTEGSAAGMLSTCALHGHVHYVTGGGFFFLFAKFLQRSILYKPYLFAGIAMLWGYLRARVTDQRLLVTSSEAAFYRQLLNARLKSDAGRVLRLGKLRRQEQGSN